MADTDYRELVSSAYAEAEAAQSEAAPVSDGVVAAPPDAALSGDESGGAGVLAGVSGGAADGVSPDGGADRSGNGAQRARDAQGKFTKAQKQATQAIETATKPPAKTQTDSTPAPVAAEPTATPPPAMKAPQSWTPAEREHFAKAPPEVQAAISRREREAAIALQEAAPDRRFAQEMRTALAPIQDLMQVRGVSPAQAMASYAQYDRLLSNPSTSAAAAWKLIQSYGIPLEAINAEIGRTPEQQAQQPQAVDPEAIARQAEERVFQRIALQRQQQAQAMAFDETAKFSEGKEFWEDVKDDVADILEGAARRNQKMSLEQAYQRAIRANDATYDIVKKREAAEAAKASQASMQQARVAATSVKSTPSTAASQVKTPRTYQEIVSAAWDSLDGR